MDEALIGAISLGVLVVIALLVATVLVKVVRIEARLRTPGAPGAAAPAEVVAPTPEATAAPVPSAAPSEQEEAPEGPFERDGRWWFRRGEELLVYDEQRGEWTPEIHPLEDASGWDEVPVAVVDAPSSIAAPGTSEPAGSPAPTGPDEPVKHWRCPTCGAVNGLTAASCRMCFAARP